MKSYDVAIIGAGTSGLAARKQVAKETDSYVVVDNGVLGTTCARVGCMPSKVIIQVANDYHRRKTFSSVGIEGSQNLSVDSKKVMEHVRSLRDRFVKATMSGYEGWRNDHLITKKATFIDENTLDLEGEKIYAKKVIIATGSRPIVPDDWKEFNDLILDTNGFFELKELPKKMAVIGLGVIGIELGQALHRLGVDVIAINKGKLIGGLSDPDIVEYSSSKFSKEMNVDYSGVESLSRSSSNGKLVIQSQNDKYEVDKALVAIGRRPNLDKLGLDKLGVSMDKKGRPNFKLNSMQIEGTSLYIAGDVNADRPLLHEAVDEGSVAGHNSVADKTLLFKRRTYLGITFCDPNIATVGKKHIDLTKENINFVTGEASFEGQGRSIVKLKEIGLLKLYGSADNGLILGAELFCPSGEHIAHLIAWAIQAKMTVHQVLSMPFYHPVIEEGLRTALRDLAKKVPEVRSPLEIAMCQDEFTKKC